MKSPEFADRADQVGDQARRADGRLLDRAQIVVRIVERRPHQIVHAGIDDDEVFASPRFT